MFRAGGVPLTDRELTVAAALKRYPSAISPDRLAIILYGDDPDGGPIDATGVIKVFLHRLRKKIERAGIPWRIDNVYGEGYVLRSEDPKVHKKAIASLAVTVGFSLLLVHPVMALAQRLCVDGADMVTTLQNKYGEERVSVAITDTGKLLERYENPKSGGWTIVVYPNGEMACVFATGKDWYDKKAGNDPEA